MSLGVIFRILVGNRGEFRHTYELNILGELLKKQVWKGNGSKRIFKLSVFVLAPFVAHSLFFLGLWLCLAILKLALLSL